MPPSVGKGVLRKTPDEVYAEVLLSHARSTVSTHQNVADTLHARELHVEVGIRANDALVPSRHEAPQYLRPLRPPRCVALHPLVLEAPAKSYHSPGAVETALAVRRAIDDVKAAAI